MSDRQSFSDVEAERARNPLGKPASYRPGHKNYLDPDYLPRRPNRIPLGERVLNILVSLFLLAYGGHGLMVDDLYIPGRRTAGMHLHGFAAVSMGIAMACAVAMLLAVVIDHYDTRDNEGSYRRFLSLMKYPAVLFLVLSIVLH